MLHALTSLGHDAVGQDVADETGCQVTQAGGSPDLQGQDACQALADCRYAGDLVWTT